MAMGFAMFLVMLIFAVNLMFNLYTTSVVSSLAIDAARDVAEFDGNDDKAAAIAQAEAEFLARFPSTTTFDIEVVGGDTVVASVEWEAKSLLPSFGTSVALGKLDRTFSVRVEEQQAAP